jgi:hypothetical protein
LYRYIVGLPDGIRADVNFFVYGKYIVEAISGDAMPTAIIIKMVCRSMAPEVFTRDTPLSMPNKFVVGAVQVELSRPTA